MENSVNKFIMYLEDVLKGFVFQLRESSRVNILSTVIDNASNLEVINVNNKQLLNDIENKCIEMVGGEEMFESARIIDTLLSSFKLSQTEDWKKKNNVFSNYELISAALVASPLKAKERFDVLLYTFIKNTYVADERFTKGRVASLHNDSKILDYLKPLENEPLEEIFSKKVAGYRSKEVKDYTKEDIKFLDLLNESLKDEKENKHFIRLMITIKEHLIEKEKRNAEDIKLIIESLESLKVEKELISSVEYLLQKELEKQENKNEELHKNNEKKEAVQEDVIPWKEYNKIFKEIESMYDIQNQKIVKPLDMESLIYLVSLMLKVKIEESEIEKCILNVYKEVKMSQNVFQQLNYFLPKISESNSESVKKSLETIKSYLEEMIIPTSKDDYVFWKNEIIKETHDIFSEVNKEYEYELEMAHSLNK